MKRMERSRPWLRRIALCAGDRICMVFSENFMLNSVAVMPLYRRNLPHIERDDASYFVSFGTRHELILSEDARTLIFNHCLFENGRKVELHAVVVMPDHVHLLFTPL